MAEHWLSQLGIHPLGGHQTLTLLLMLCCNCRHELSMGVLWEALPVTEWEMEIFTAKHWIGRINIVKMTTPRYPFSQNIFVSPAWSFGTYEHIPVTYTIKPTWDNRYWRKISDPITKHYTQQKLRKCRWNGRFSRQLPIPKLNQN